MKLLPNFLDVFEGRLNKIKDRIKRELELPKEKRSKHSLKSMIREANDLKRWVRKVKDEHGVECPHCGKRI